GQQGADQGTHLEQLMPVLAGAGQSARLQPEGDPDLAEGDIGEEPPEPGPRVGPLAALPLVLVDDFDSAGRPAEGGGMVGERGRGGSTGAGWVSDMRRPLPKDDRHDGRTSRPTPVRPTPQLLAGRRQIATVCQPWRCSGGFHWPALNRFTENGFLNIDNNAS